MASANEERARAGIAAFNEDGAEGILEYIHPDFEATTPPELASEPDTYRGHDGVRRYYDSFDEVMDEIRWEVHGTQAVGEQVVVDLTLHARGKSTGLDFGMRTAAVWSFRDGKVIGIEIYPTLDEALAATRPGGE
ncbi:MAG: nuclear transport factor 2 family protein [Solirubrobacterales bacterium]